MLSKVNLIKLSDDTKNFIGINMIYNFFFKKIIDFISAIFLLIILSPITILICIAIKIDSKGPILHWSKRVGKNSKFFLMPKFRTMKVKSPQVASALLKNPKKYLTSFGTFLRKTSMDEIPQLYSILQGKMSLVGPRPALFNQTYLIKLRKLKGIDKYLPGITGLAQVNGRDNLSLKQKIHFDINYCGKINLLTDIKILFLTILIIFNRKSKKDISH